MTVSLTRTTLSAQSGETLFDDLLAQVPGQLFQICRLPDGRTELRYVSPHTAPVFGIDVESVMREGFGAMRRVHPDDQAALNAVLEDAEARGARWQHEYRVIFPDGSVHWVSTHAQARRMPDGTVLTHGLSVNIDERKAAELALQTSEERFQRAAEAAGLGVATVDLQTEELQFDERACRNHGLSYPHPRYTIPDWLNQVHPEDRAGAQATLARALQESRTVEGRYRFVRLDGQIQWLEILVCAQRDAQGQATSLIGTCRDVTDAQEAAQLREEKAAVERASRAKSQFLSRVSHELRTPLNAILGFAQLMAFDQRAPLPPDQLTRLERVQQAGRHLLALINDMLDLARVEQDDFSFQLEPLSIDELLSASFALVQPLAAAGGIALQAAEPTGWWVQADARTLQQVLINLLSNAIKYNRPEGRVWLCVTELPAEPAADGARGEPRVRIDVCDNGCGLSEADQRRLFQPFTRLGADAHRIEGSGLGLVIARQLTEAMGGQLLVRSQLGQGSVFSIVLPRSQASVPPMEITMTTTTTPSPAAQERHVLYIEDQPLNVMLMEELFRSEPQWRLHIATDGASALEALQTLRPDLMLIDMHLPDTDGHQLLQAIKARSEGGKPVAPCIALSADAMPEQIEQARQSGFDDYWTKPIDVAVVLTQLHRWLKAA